MKHLLLSCLTIAFAIATVQAQPKGTFTFASKGELPSAFVGTDGLRLSANPWRKPLMSAANSPFESFALSKTMIKTQAISPAKILIKAGEGTGTFRIGETF